MAQQAAKTPAPTTAPKAPSGPAAAPTVANAPASRSNRGMASLFRSSRSSAAAPPPASNLTISSSTDPAEIEAERIAGEVMRMPAPAPNPDDDERRVHRQIAPAVLHRACDACEDEEKVHRSATGDDPGTAPPVVGQVLSRPGQPLPDATPRVLRAAVGGGPVGRPRPHRHPGRPLDRRGAGEGVHRRQQHRLRGWAIRPAERQRQGVVGARTGAHGAAGGRRKP